MAKNDLEDRLINFAILIIGIAEKLPGAVVGMTLSGQMIRSSTSSALNYGEAQSAESTKDFIHKMKVVLKELRETYVCLRIVKGAHLYKDETKLGFAINENNELISIFVTSINTARKNLTQKKVT
ncbi:MAG TPA: four helix bundle protein [Saprospiraceae bacterium]|nr:four helix bundle protein [Saprospiraceae bacterium]